MEFEELLKKSILEKPSKDIIKLWKYSLLYQRRRLNILNFFFYYVIPMTFALSIFVLKITKFQVNLDFLHFIHLITKITLENYPFITLIIVYFVIAGITKLLTE